MRPCRSTTKRFMRRALPGFEVARGRGAIDLHPAKRDLRDVEPVDHPGGLSAADGESARRGLVQQDLVVGHGPRDDRQPIEDGTGHLAAVSDLASVLVEGPWLANRA